jgi:RHS repeat-associated protein
MQYVYDNQNRLKDITETIGSEVFTRSFAYDIFGRVKDYTYPVTGFTIQNHYNKRGYLESISNSATGTVYWKANEMNAMGQYKQTVLGGNITQNYDYYISGRLHKTTVSNLQQEEYQWDPLGNLNWRKSRNGRTEIFNYDNRNRLIYTGYFDPNQFTWVSESIEYDVLGNIESRTGIGQYEYDNTNPYKLVSINNVPVDIDTRKYDIAYNSFNKVTTIKQYAFDTTNETNRLELIYGVNNQRIKQKIQSFENVTTAEKQYIGGDFEKHSEIQGANQSHKYVHYINSPQGLIAIMTQTSLATVGDSTQTGTHELNYVLKDHLGSTQVLVRPNGTVVSEFSYDAWGRRRDPVTWVVYSTGALFSTDKGFTGHEHIDLFQLVNMNGRIYDPFIGRFLSPDPVLQFPDYTQGLNPYAYCLNNPLSLTDPDGYSVQGQFIALYFSTFITVASGGTLWWLSPIVYQTVMTIDYAIENRHADYNLNLGRYFFTGIAISYVQAVATMGIGKIVGEISNEFGKEFIRSLLHGGANGAIRKAQGGRFEHGFLSGFVSSLGGNYAMGIENDAVKIMISAAIGGTGGWQIRGALQPYG